MVINIPEWKRGPHESPGLHHGAEGHVVEEVREQPPDVGGPVLPHALCTRKDCRLLKDGGSSLAQAASPPGAKKAPKGHPPYAVRGGGGGRKKKMHVRVTVYKPQKKLWGKRVCAWLSSLEAWRTVIEAIYLGDLTALVVAAGDGHPILVPEGGGGTRIRATALAEVGRWVQHKAEYPTGGRLRKKEGGGCCLFSSLKKHHQ